MIKLALKHWIFDRCIDVIFDNVTNNFSPRIKCGFELYRGNLFTKMVCWEGNHTRHILHDGEISYVYGNTVHIFYQGRDTYQKGILQSSESTGSKNAWYEMEVDIKNIVKIIP